MKYLLILVLLLISIPAQAQYYSSSQQAYRSGTSVAIERAPGPRHSYPHAGCMMCLGNHLIGSHGFSYNYLNSVGYNNWETLHDNAHNGVVERAKPVSKIEVSISNLSNTDVNFLLLKTAFILKAKSTKVYRCPTKMSITYHQGNSFGNISKDLEHDSYNFKITSKGWVLEPVVEPIYAPTPQNIVEAMLRLSRVTSNEVLVDMGCGDGRIPITAAKKYGCKSAGFEIQYKLADLAKKNAKKDGVEDLVTIYTQDMFKVTLKNVDVVTLYLEEDLNKKLVPLLRQMKPGSRIISYAHKVPGLENEKIIIVPDKMVYNLMPSLYNMEPIVKKHTVYLYTIGD